MLLSSQCPLQVKVFRNLVRPRVGFTMMRYTIKRKRLPKARKDQVYTLTVYMGFLGEERSNKRGAMVQYPVISHREGICKYRDLTRMQRLLDAHDTIPVPTTSKVLKSKVPARSSNGHSQAMHKSPAKRPAKSAKSKDKQIPMAV